MQAPSNHLKVPPKINLKTRIRFSARTLCLSSVSFLMISCATHPTSRVEDVLNSKPTESPSAQEPQTPVFAEKRLPKLGVILGPGGARTQAYIGFLRELEKAQISIQHIAGVEWGALIAALYAQKGKANDVEWQISKLDARFFKESLLSSSTKDFNDLRPYLKTVFESSKIETGKLGFICPGTRSSDHYSGIFYKGVVVDVMSYCLSFYPLLKPYQNWYAGVSDLKAVQDYLKKQGIEYVVFVDSLLESAPAGLTEESRILWSLVSKSVKTSEVLFHKVVKLDIRSQLNDFKDRKNQISIGEQAGKKFVQEFKYELGIP